jgi:hypothetical protein
MFGNRHAVAPCCSFRACAFVFVPLSPLPSSAVSLSGAQQYTCGGQVTVEMQAKLHALEVGPASPTASPTASPSPSPYPSRVGGPGEGFGASGGSGGSAAPPQPASSPVHSLGPAVAAHASPSDSASNVTSPQGAES